MSPPVRPKPPGDPSMKAACVSSRDPAGWPMDDPLRRKETEQTAGRTSGHGTPREQARERSGGPSPSPFRGPFSRHRHPAASPPGVWDSCQDDVTARDRFQNDPWERFLRHGGFRVKETRGSELPASSLVTGPSPSASGDLRLFACVDRCVSVDDVPPSTQGHEGLSSSLQSCRKMRSTFQKN